MILKLLKYDTFKNLSLDKDENFDEKSQIA